VVDKTQKFKLIAALQQRQTESLKGFLDRCKTAWYGLLRKLRTKIATDVEKAAHDDTRNECIKCMFICGMRNDIRMAV
jgi:predicted acetyltransferase